jgi:2-polyprenyl-6-methoxyphenol hydroxylase-like FAD-dependent oxidoreductase
MRVLIVGCGIAGLAAAISLTSNEDDDVHITIVERRSDLDSRGATFGLQINGQNALKAIAGVVDDKPCKMLEKLASEGLLIPSTKGYMLPWFKVRDVLLEEVKAREDKIKIHLGVSIDTVTEKDNGSYIATFKDDSLQIDADLIIGADGVNSYVRREILSLPRATGSGAFVWRGSVDTNANNSSDDKLKQFQEYPIAKMTNFGEAMIMTYFNFHPKVEGQVAWVFTVRASMLPDTIKIDCGNTTPIELIKAYMDNADVDADEGLKETYELAMTAFNNTHQPSDLTWSHEMAVVDLNQNDIGWGGKGRITLIGDAAHSLRPASGLGGSLAFEDAALLARYIARSNTSSAASIEEQLREFEKIRLPRCKSISNDQSIRSELSYKLGFGAVPTWDPAYAEWIKDGIDSTPEPPVSEMGVFAGMLSD